MSRLFRKVPGSSTQIQPAQSTGLSYVNYNRRLISHVAMDRQREYQTPDTPESAARLYRHGQSWQTPLGPAACYGTRGSACNRDDAIGVNLIRGLSARLLILVFLDK